MRYAPSLRACLLAAAPLTLTLPASGAGYYQVNRFDDTAPATGGVSGDLRHAIIQANADPGAMVFIPGPATITLQGPLPVITASMTVEGYNLPTISGNSLHRLFFIDAPGSTVAINNLKLQNGRAKGGDGGFGGGGGGLGAGAAIFCNRGNVQASAVTFLNHLARGGDGGAGSDTIGGGGGGGLGGAGGAGGGLGGGGGGFGGAGGSASGGSGGGGGLIAAGGKGASNSGAPIGGGGGALGAGADAVSAGDLGGAGGSGGGGDGGGFNHPSAPGQTYGGGGGGAGIPVYLSYAYDGRNGGRFGGGGGGACHTGALAGSGGEFGGGGGNDAEDAHAGHAGWGGGGGGITASNTGSTEIPGSGGFGGGGGGSKMVSSTGGTYGGNGGKRNTYWGVAGGGGGAALGGEVFVRETATFTSQACNFTGATLQAGAAGLTGPGSPTPLPAQAGTAAGSSLFTRGVPFSFDGTADQTISGTLADDTTLAAAGLTKSGTGTLTLSGANTYRGDVSLNGGTLSVPTFGALGAGGAVNFSGGTTLRYTGASATLGHGLSVGGAVILDISSAAATVESTGPLSGSGNFAKYGAGTLVLNGTNTFTGPVNVSAGTLQVGKDTATAFPAFSPIAIGSGASLVMNRSDSSEIHGQITGGGQLHKRGSGSLRLFNANTFSGGSRLYTGRLEIGNDSALGTGGLLIFGGEIRAAGAPRTLSNSMVLSGNFTIGRLTTLSGNASIPAGQIRITAENPDGPADGDSTLSGAIGGIGPLTLATGPNGLGTGSIVLSGANTFSNGVRVKSGVRLKIFSDANLGAVAGGTQLAMSDGSRLRLGANAATTRHLYLGAEAFGGTITLELGGFVAGFPSVEGTANAALETGTLQLGSGSYMGQFSGAGAVLKTGSGTLTLAAANLHTGGTTIAEGVLQIGSADSLGPAGSQVIFQGGTLRSPNSALTIPHPITLAGDAGLGQALSFTGQANLTAANVTLATSNEVPADWDTTFSGVISGNGALTIAAGPGGLGTGSIVLSGANTYTGGTTVNAGGRLHISSDANLGDFSSGLSLGGGGTVVVGGSFFSSRSLTLLSGGGTLDPAGNVLFMGALGGSGPLTLGAGRLTMLSGSSSGVISGPGTFGKGGEGTLTLYGANTYSGGTSLTGGILGIGHNSALGSGTLTISGGNIRAVDAVRHLSNAVTVNGGFTLGRVTNFTGPVTLNSANLTITADNPDGAANADSTISGAIGGNSTLSIAAGPNGLGSGAIVFTGTNTYSGGTVLLPGARLAITSDASLGAAANNLTFSGGRLRLDNTISSARMIELNAAGGEIETNSHNAIFPNLTGSGALTKSGSGALVLSGTLNHAGNLAVTGGTLSLRSGTLSGALSGAGDLYQDGYGTVTLSGNNGSFTGQTQLGTGTQVHTAATGSGSFWFYAGNSSVLELNYPAGYDGGFSNNTSFNGQGILRKTGAGTVRWASQAATFALHPGSLIDVQAGTFVGGSFANEVWTNNYAALHVASGAEFNGVEANVQVDGLSGGGTIRSGIGAVPSTYFSFGIMEGSGTFSGTLADNGSSPGRYRKLGGGTQVLTGSNTFTGGLEIHGGIVQVGDGGTTGSLMGGVQGEYGSNLAFRRSDATTYAAAFTGFGMLSHSGGTLTLSGQSTGMGELAVLSGRVIVTGSWGGFMNVSNGGRLSLAGGTIGWANAQHIIQSGGLLDGSGTVNGWISNSGTIGAGAGETLAINGHVVTNEPGGVMRAISGGTLDLSGVAVLVNKGTIDLISGTVILPPNFTNNGVLLDSRVVRVSSASRTGNVITIKMPGHAAHSYQLQKSTDLSASSFTNLGTPQAGTGAELTFTDSEGGPSAYYRVVVD